ncbi:MAG: hypothetical protein KA239_09535 [Bacteroidia bacterium]|jgi:hypothetical protein|nr:hypothetical protein [Bacteroidia bacterium]
MILSGVVALPIADYSIAVVASAVDCRLTLVVILSSLGLMRYSQGWKEK